MKTWQRYWLYAIATIAILHLYRDVSQDVKFSNFLSVLFVKEKASWYPWWYYWIFNTYAFELIEIGIVALCLKRNSFGKAGYLSILLFGIIFNAWLFYWFFL